MVLTTQRSGSTWVMSVLNNMENTTAQGELFLRRARTKARRWDSDFACPRFVETKPTGLGVRPFSTFSYLDSLYAAPGATGFKLMYDQLRQYPEILPYMVWRRVRVIHLIRRNHLDVLISFGVKARLGQAHLLDGQRAPDDLRVTLDTENLIARLQRLEMKQRIARLMLRSSPLPSIEVNYEDLLADPSSFRKLWDFLGLDPGEVTPTSSLVKIRRAGHADALNNYHEVKEVMSKSAFADLID